MPSQVNHHKEQKTSFFERHCTIIWLSLGWILLTFWANGRKNNNDKNIDNDDDDNNIDDHKKPALILELT